MQRLISNFWLKRLGNERTACVVMVLTQSFYCAIPVLGIQKPKNHMRQGQTVCGVYEKFNFSFFKKFSNNRTGVWLNIVLVGTYGAISSFLAGMRTPMVLQPPLRNDWYIIVKLWANIFGAVFNVPFANHMEL